MYKILFVEDDEMISEIYEKKLGKAGFMVDLARSGQEVIKKVKEGQYDLVLLDIVLPDMNGLEVLEKLHAEGRTGENTRIIMFSNLNDRENQEKAMLFGASGFIPKSQFNPSEFVTEVKRRFEIFYEQGENKQRLSEPSKHVTEVREKHAKKRIVFIEDEAIFLDLFIQKLRDAGFDVVVARSGLDGLEAIYTQETNLVITDVVMPKMRGDEVVRRLKGNPQTSKIPVIVLSASVTDDEIKKIRQYGVQDFFVKTDITPSDLTRRVRDILG